MGNNWKIEDGGGRAPHRAARADDAQVRRRVFVAARVPARVAVPLAPWLSAYKAGSRSPASATARSYPVASLGHYSPRSALSRNASSPTLNSDSSGRLHVWCGGLP